MLKYCLCFFLFLPFIVAAGVIVWHGVPDALPDGDAALIEIATRAALDGDQFTGPYSRGGFNHPGPFYFYLLAPLYWLTNGSSLSLNLTVVLINMLSIAGMLMVGWQCTNTWAYLWCALLLSYYSQYLGPTICLSIWNPFVTILAFLCAVLCFAAVATGRSTYLPLAVITSSFVVQTHLGYFLAIMATGIFSLALFALPNLRRVLGINPAYRGNVRNVIIISGGLLAILWAFPCIEQFSESPGNLSKILHFFTKYPGEHSWHEVYKASCGIFSNYVLAAFKTSHPEKQLLLQGPIPGFSHLIVWGQGIFLAIAYFVARRRQQDYFVALSLVCSILYVATVISLKRLVGPMLAYLLIWMTGPGMLIWIVIGGVCLHALESKLRNVGGRLFQWSGMFLTAIMLISLTAVNVHTFFNESQQIVTNRDKNTSTRDLDQIVSKSLDFFHKTGRSDCLLRASEFHLWPAVAGLALKMTKTGITAMVDPQWPTKYPARYFPSSIPGGVFLVCPIETGKRFQKIGNLAVVAETQDCMVFWRAFTEGLEGHFLFELLPAYAFKYKGFSKTGYIAEDSFRWSSDDASMMLIRLDQTSDYRVTITAAIPEKVRTIRVSLNGNFIAELAFPGEWRWQEFVVQLPGEYVNAVNELTLQYIYREPPENPRVEGRHGSLVAFKSIAFEKIGKESTLP